MEFFKNVTNAQLRVALLVLLGILLLWGGLKLLLGIGFGPLVDQLVPNGVMVGAVIVFAWNRWLYNQELKRKETEASTKTEDEKSE